MNPSVLLAFIHHVAAFTLVGALMVELALFGSNLDLRQARKVQRADLAYGMSAGILLVAGLLRVLYFEKGGAYYFHNGFFIAKMSLFLLVALLSIYPTVLFVSWSKQLKTGLAPQLEDAQVRRVRAVILLELLGVVGILLCAPLMARGIGMIE
jgi:putative membrane protein